MARTFRIRLDPCILNGKWPDRHERTFQKSPYFNYEGNAQRGRVLHLLSKIMYTSKLPHEKNRNGSELWIQMEDGTAVAVWYLSLIHI